MKTMKILPATIFILFIAVKVGFSQNSLNDLNIVLKHDFENNTLGNYKYSEWEKDWGYPEWSNRQSELDIAQSTEDKANPSKTLLINYPAESVGPEEGGTNWWTFLNGKYEELYVSYDIMFMPGFQYQKGGKLPSVKGGSVETLGDFERPDGYDGFAVGLMFKENGRLVFYLYYPDSKVDWYGESFTWGFDNYEEGYLDPSRVQFPYSTDETTYASPGVWHNITVRIGLNSVTSSGGNADGILEAYFNGKLVLQMSHVLFRHTTKLGIDCFRTVTFFGGNSDDWRNPISEWMKLDNVLLYTYQDHMNVPRGRELSPTDRKINYWRNFNEDNPTSPEPVPEPVPVPAPEPVVTPAPEPITEPVEDNEPVVIINNPPIISNQNFTINESSFKNNYIGKITSSDPDAGQVISYAIISGNTGGQFAIDNQSGELRTITDKVFGPGTLSYELEVQVTDNAPQPKNARAKIHINLIGQSTVVYIDPLNNQDILANGSIDHPYDSWMDVTWKNGYTYLQKKGTSLSVEKIFLGASNVKLGAYGEGDLPVISSKTTTYLLSAFEKDNIVIENLQFDAPDATSCFYFLGSSIENIVIEHCKLVGNVNGIKAVGVSSFTSKYNVITSDHEGIYSTAENNDIYYNIFKLCKTAINVMSYQSDANVYNNVFYNNQQSLALTYASLKLFNNIFYMSSPDQKALSLGNGEIESDHNIFYPDQSGFVTIANKIFNNLDELQRELRIDLNSFNSDPMFVDIFSQNFSLSPESPAINAGTNLNLVLDLEGSSVPVAGNPDIGSIEFGQQIQKNPGNIEQESILKLYPNPSNGQFTLFAELEQDNTLNSQLSAAHPEIKIMDVSGKLVFIRNMEKTGSIIQENIDLTGISNGLYFVILQFADKIVKEKLLINR